jgi:hypothetical protein
VRGIRLDTFARQQNIERIDFLKIDVEGAEADVLRGARELLAGGKVPLVQFEISQEMLAGMKRSAREVFELLESYEYECRRITGEGTLGDVAHDSQSYYENYAAVPRLPVHFFTIVLNGGDAIRRHVEQFQRLGFAWRWHIFEGSDQPGVAGLSNDGTSEYLDGIASADGRGRITIYRKTDAAAWQGRTEMLGLLPQVIGDACLLWEVDPASQWTAEQIGAARKLFLDQPAKTAAIVAEANLRIWRFRPEMRWANQLPPLLAEPIGPNQWRDVATVNPFSRFELQSAGI